MASFIDIDEGDEVEEGDEEEEDEAEEGFVEPTSTSDDEPRAKRHKRSTAVEPPEYTGTMLTIWTAMRLLVPAGEERVIANNDANMMKVMRQVGMQAVRFGVTLGKLTDLNIKTVKRNHTNARKMSWRTPAEGLREGPQQRGTQHTRPKRSANKADWTNTRSRGQ
jgi:hypothetical protein